MAVSTEVTGIFQGDLVIRSAVIVALQELRDNPTLIQDALASLPQDDLTSQRYGDKTVQQCVDWFTNTKIPVKLGLNLSMLSSPCIAIELNNQDEAESTIGDVNYEASEPDPYNPGLFRKLASLQARESYNVTVLVQGEPELMLFLYTLVLFGLLRHKEDLLDDRGYNRLTFSVGVAAKLDEVPGAEQFFLRAIRLNGYSRHCYPVPLDPSNRNGAGIIDRVEFGPRIAAVATDATGTASSSPVTPDQPTVAGSGPFDPADWDDRDIISGHKS